MILTIGPGGCGFTFLNWSISYLLGDSYYNTLTGQKIQVDINPIHQRTAHSFRRDHLRPEDNKNILNLASEKSIVYIVPGDHNDFESLLNYSSKKIIFDSSKFCRELMARNYLTVPNSPYATIAGKLADQYDIDSVKNVLLDLSSQFLNYYRIPTSSDTTLINYYEIFDTLDTKILEIFEFLNLTIDQERYKKWLNIYREYKSINNNILDNFTSKSTSSNNTQILKEILKWKNGSYRPI